MTTSLRFSDPGLDDFLPGEGEQLVGQAGGAFRGPLDLLDVVADVGQFMPGSGWPAPPGEGGVVRDDAEQVVEVVCYPPAS